MVRPQIACIPSKVQGEGHDEVQIKVGNKNLWRFCEWEPYINIKFPSILYWQELFSHWVFLSVLSNTRTVYSWVYFCVSDSLALVCVSVFTPVPYLFDYYRFLCSLKSRHMMSTASVLSEDCFGIWSLL